MPLTKEQLKSDFALEQSARASRPRLSWNGPLVFSGIAISGIAGGYYTPSVGHVLLPLLAAALLAVVLAKHEKEKQLIAARTVAIATITSWKKSDDDSGNKTEVTYQFLAADGQVYSGTGGSTRNFPKEGGCIPVLYRAEDPKENTAMAALYFYRFPNDGTA